MELPKALWRGEVSLAKTFWLFGWGVSFVLFISEIVIIYLISHLSPISKNEDLIPYIIGHFIYWIIMVFHCFYYPFILICIWKSSNKYPGLKAYSFHGKIFGYYGMGVLY